MLVVAHSLLETAHAVNDRLYAGLPIGAAEREEAARFIAERQGLAPCYAGSFAGFPAEVAAIQLYTGEKVSSASARHLLGEECCRALRLLAPKLKMANEALKRADAGLLEAVHRSDRDPRYLNPGFFCCGTCTVGMWRNLLSGGLDRREERLARGVERLKEGRDGKGGWTRFPFWYAALALAEINAPAASRELERVRPKLERAAKSKAKGPAAERRRALAIRALDRL